MFGFVSMPCVYIGESGVTTARIKKVKFILFVMQKTLSDNSLSIIRGSLLYKL